MKKPLKMVVFFKMFEKCLNVTKEKVLYLNIASVYNSSLKFFINYNYYHYFIHVLDLLKCCLLSKSALTDLFLGKKPSLERSRFILYDIEISVNIQIMRNSNMVTVPKK